MRCLPCAVQLWTERVPDCRLHCGNVLKEMHCPVFPSTVPHIPRKIYHIPIVHPSMCTSTHRVCHVMLLQGLSAPQQGVPLPTTPTSVLVCRKSPTTDCPI